MAYGYTVPFQTRINQDLASSYNNTMARNKMLRSQYRTDAEYRGNGGWGGGSPYGTFNGWPATGGGGVGFGPNRNPNQLSTRGLGGVAVPQRYQPGNSSGGWGGSGAETFNQGGNQYTYTPVSQTQQDYYDYQWQQRQAQDETSRKRIAEQATKPWDPGWSTEEYAGNYMTDPQGRRWATQPSSQAYMNYQLEMYNQRKKAAAAPSAPSQPEADPWQNPTSPRSPYDRNRMRRYGSLY